MYKISTPLEISDFLVLHHFLICFETLSHSTGIPIFALIAVFYFWQLNSMGGSVEHRPEPNAHGAVIFARMVIGNEEIFTPELKHEEISNSQITTNNNK